MGIPLNHPFIDHILHEINHPAIGCHMRKPPYVDMYISYIDPEPPRNEG
jgi:histidinol phosphatase-like enzyme